jgi:DNA-binding beta-propeller fold protein YncE
MGLLLITGSLFTSCKHDEEEVEPGDGNFPEPIAEIMITRCATPGCHNTTSKDAASGLDLSSWDKMFEGNNNGAVTIPYRSGQSTLFYFVNSDSSLGITQLPTMPFNQPALTNAEVIAIRDWIDNGAPDKNGNIKFADDPNRHKFYISNQGCDVIGVHDGETAVVMRYVDVGISGAIESPHMIKMSPDGQYWYVIFLNSDVMQRFRVSDDTFVDEVNITQGSWNTFSITSDGKYAFAVDFSNTGRIAFVDLENMTLELIYSDPGFFTNPHGSYISPDDNTLMVTQNIGNQIFKWDISDPYQPDYEALIVNPSGTSDPHEVIYHPNGAKYYVSCEAIDEVWVFNSVNDSLIATIPTGDFPQEFTLSPKHELLFVSNMIGNSVTIIDTNDDTFVKTLTTGYEPHGLAVDDKKDLVYVANRNTPVSGGPPPHHVSECGGRNGYLTIIDINTLELVPGYKTELSVDPYSVMVRK